MCFVPGACQECSFNSLLHLNAGHSGSLAKQTELVLIFIYSLESFLAGYLVQFLVTSKQSVDI